MPSYNTASLLDENMNFKVGAGLDEISAQYDKNQKEREATDLQNKEMAKNVATGMSSGAGLGGSMFGAGLGAIAGGAPVMGAAGALGGAGLALALWEQKQKAEAAEEQAKIQEAENRKAATQNAINSMINVTRGLGV